MAQWFRGLWSLCRWTRRQKIVETCLKTVDFNLKALEIEPDEAFALYDLAISYYEIARGYRLSGDANRSIEYAQKAFEIMSKLDKTAPGTNDYVRVIAVVENEIADSQTMLGQTEKALENLQKAQTKLEKVVETDNSVTAYQAELANVYRSLAAAYSKKDKAKASEFIDKAIAIVAQLKSQNNLIFSEKNTLDELEEEKTEYDKWLIENVINLVYAKGKSGKDNRDFEWNIESRTVRTWRFS